MKPLRLNLSAFGAYAEHHDLDFTELGDSRFFLIHGPTGGGKTTILDAICYALFGETSGNGRKGSQMRSQFASPEQPTGVRFDFQIGSQCYRIDRSPEQLVAKKRGEGLRQQSPAAVMWRADVGDPGPSEVGWQVSQSNSTRVTDEVRRLLGFSAEQFRQVMVLPQDRFREVLEASSKDREEILETLFQTERFSRIAEQLKRQARELEEQHRQLDADRSALLAQAQAGGIDELALRLSELEQQAATTTTQLEAASARQREVESLSQAAAAVAVRFEELDAARTESQRLEARLPEIQEKQSRLEIARLANEVVPFADAVRKAEAAWKKLKAEADTATEAVSELQENLATAQSALKQADSQQPEAEKLKREVIRLDQLQPLLAQWVAAEKGDREAKTAAESARQEVNQTEAEWERVYRELQQAEEAARVSERAAETIAALKPQIDAVETSLRNLREQARLANEIARQRDVVELAQQDVNRKAGALTDAERQLADEQARWDSGQAALLASALVADQPCPVCGATHHPQPAQPTAGRLPSEAALKKHRDAVDQSRRAVATAEKQTNDAHNLLTSLQARADSIPRSTDRESELAARQSELARQLDKASRAANDLETVRQRRQQLGDRHTSLAGQLTQLRSRFAEAERCANQAAANRAALEQQLPAELRSESAWQSARSAAERKLTDLEAARARAADNVTKVERALLDAKGKRDFANKSAHEAFEVAEAARRDFQSARQTRHFFDDAAWRQACLERPQQAELEQQVGEYQRQQHAARERLARAEQATQNLTRPDCQPLEAQLAECRRQVDEHQEQRAQFAARREQLLNVRAALQTKLDQLQRLDEQYATVGKVSDAVNGKNAAGLTLQRFVLAAFLDDVLLTASQRLQRMSRGRFTLNRKEGKVGQRRTAGLDLEVLDDFTGQTRDVSTLSGGEGFLASLALALGLADVVQAYSGGIRLDTLFIDEGFGSLDSEALDEAINILMDLQTGGRLVGIISHVPELRERINVRLEVTPTRTGSTARFVVP